MLYAIIEVYIAKNLDNSSALTTVIII